MLRDAARVKADPTNSIVADRREENARHFLETVTDRAVTLTGRQKIVRVFFAATFAVMT